MRLRLGIINRAVTRAECHWLKSDLAIGTAVYEYNGATYGCITPTGVAVTVVPGETPFFEVPASAVTWIGHT